MITIKFYSLVFLIINLITIIKIFITILILLFIIFSHHSQSIQGQFLYQKPNFMNQKSQTRGRPKKKNDQRLPQISRILFSEHCAVFFACCMIYVLQTFLKTKHEKRIGHSEGGFTIYQRINETYCFQSIEKDCKNWGLNKILKSSQLLNFIKISNGCAPKFVFKQILILIEEIIDLIEYQKIQSIQQLQNNQCRLWANSQNQINKKYKYIRFSSPALKQLKMQKWHNQVSIKVKQLWKPFLKIISHSIFCIIKNIQKNKYLKSFFSDAQHPQQTIIGQLNLQQIISQENNQYEKEKSRDQLANSKQILSIQTKATQRKDSSLSNQFLNNNVKIPQNNGKQLCQSLKFNSPSARNQSINYSAMPRGTFRPVTLITHPSLQSQKRKSSEYSSIQECSQKILYLNAPSKVNFQSNHNIDCQNISIQEKIQTNQKNQKNQKYLLKNQNQIKLFQENQPVDFNLMSKKRIFPVLKQQLNDKKTKKRLKLQH